MTTPAGWHSPIEPPHPPTAPPLQVQLRRRRRTVIVTLRGRVFAFWGKP